MSQISPGHSYNASDFLPFEVPYLLIHHELRNKRGKFGVKIFSVLFLPSQKGYKTWTNTHTEAKYISKIDMEK